MTRLVYRVEVDRLVVKGAGADRLASAETRALVERAVKRELRGVSTLAGGEPAMASAIAARVSGAVTDGRPHA